MVIPIKDLNVRSETVNFLEENIGKKFLDIGFSKFFLDLTLKTQAIKAQIDSKDYIKLKNSSEQGNNNKEAT